MGMFRSKESKKIQAETDRLLPDELRKNRAERRIDAMQRRAAESRARERRDEAARHAEERRRMTG